MNHTPSTIGDVVRRRRRQVGFTLDELAVRCGASKGYLSLIETSRCRPPSDAKLTAIGTALLMDPEELLALKALAILPPDPQARGRLLAALEKACEQPDPGTVAAAKAVLERKGAQQA